MALKEQFVVDEGTVRYAVVAHKGTELIVNTNSEEGTLIRYNTQSGEKKGEIRLSDKMFVDGVDALGSSTYIAVWLLSDDYSQAELYLYDLNLGNKHLVADSLDRIRSVTWNPDDKSVQVSTIWGQRVFDASDIIHNHLEGRESPDSNNISLYVKTPRASDIELVGNWELVLVDEMGDTHSLTENVSNGHYAQFNHNKNVAAVSSEGTVSKLKIWRVEPFNLLLDKSYNAGAPIMIYSEYTDQVFVVERSGVVSEIVFPE